MSKLQRHVQCYDAYAPLEMIQRCIREGHHVMVLMRGIPGSGKTHLANLLSSNYGGVVCSTDDFFIENGEYRFQPEKLEEYHKNNILRVREAMKDGIKPIIVDNTNIFANHMEQYALHAVTHCYEIFVVEPETSWKYAVKECYRRNVHGVDKSRIHQMLQSLEEQGRPSLSRLVGKKREVRLDPPCDVVENALVAKFSSLKCGASALPATFNGNSSDMPENDAPPGLPIKNASCIFAKLFPQNVDFTTSTLPPSVTLSLAVDTRTHVREIVVRDMATQTNEVIVTLTCAGVPCLVEDFFEGPSCSVERVKDPKIQMKDRIIRMENIPQVSELDVLIAIFPFESINNLTHYYQMMGFDGCVKLFAELGAYVDWAASVVEGTFAEDIAAAEMSATLPHPPPPRTDWQRLAEQEGMNVSDKSARMSPSPAESLCTASPLVNAINVTLNVDILQKMSVLFGNGMPIEEECNLSVPLWLLEQLYIIWQKDVRQSQHDTDVELASFLQEDEDEEAISGYSKKQMTVAQKLNLNELTKEFAACDSERVRQIYEDNKYDAAATRLTLHIMLNPDDEIESLNQIPVTPSQLPKPVAPHLLPHARPRTESTLPVAQQRALQYQREADLFAAKRAVETRKAQGYIRSGLVPAATVYQQFAREHAERERSLREKAADIIIKAHENSNFLDLHLLSQKDALALLRERLELLDRWFLPRLFLPGPEFLRNGRSDRRLRVITGYGKSSGGRAVIKPAVESYLRKKGYVYCFTNMGEIMVHCK